MKSLAADTYRLINEVFLLGDDIDRQLFSNFSLTVRQYHLLNWLHKKGQASLTELANLLLCDKSNVTGIVKRLKSAKLIEELPKSDRRYTTVRLTEAGHQIHQQATTILEDSIAIRFANVRESDHVVLQKLLEMVYGHLHGYLEAGHLESALISIGNAPKMEMPEHEESTHK
jgi:DNA-binding MarR family transcriptional regulator